jgi:hypothetical protein
MFSLQKRMIHCHSCHTVQRTQWVATCKAVFVWINFFLNLKFFMVIAENFKRDTIDKRWWESDVFFNRKPINYLKNVICCTANDNF